MQNYHGELRDYQAHTIFKLWQVICHVADINLSHLHLVPIMVNRFEFCRDHWRQKTRVPGL